MKFQDFAHPEEQVLDDATLLHIASQTNHAQLSIGEFTVHGIIDVFEVIKKLNNYTFIIDYNLCSLYANRMWLINISLSMRNQQQLRNSLQVDLQYLALLKLMH